MSDGAFKYLVHQVACLDSLESYLHDFNNILGPRQHSIVLKYPIIREWYFNEVFLGQTIELVDRRITSDSSKMKQFQLLEIIDVLRFKVKTKAKEN